jgi:hypothetical protein
MRIFTAALAFVPSHHRPGNEDLHGCFSFVKSDQVMMIITAALVFISTPSAISDRG